MKSHSKRLRNCFRRLRKRNEAALIPFLMAGDPDLATTEEMALAMVDQGADILELGVPFSDPMADGPVLQRVHLFFSIFFTQYSIDAPFQH